ncbi:hypothetical protein LEP1GSC124_3083 [Leptospira interrogans serovar Pyrogenes str. 200701872]|uniref:Uncharacterized protein n=1 Tax=Leptospira interrogans serovar Pyrogenes str. 200701872 TaxID=1193029 RepID=M6ZJ05_LEPIR|nr:hypothetical protein LEP1GSC124_3083 [Leptospira interrogans serovar Pyrogenes str. 200701872]
MERTEEFKNSVDFQRPWTMAEYRKVREKKKNPLVERTNILTIVPF